MSLLTDQLDMTSLLTGPQNSNTNKHKTFGGTTYQQHDCVLVSDGINSNTVFYRAFTFGGTTYQQYDCVLVSDDINSSTVFSGHSYYAVQHISNTTV